jgi:uncharacterized damage-inducible protein DinB
VSAGIEKIIEFTIAVRQSSLKRLRQVPHDYENWAISENALTVAEIGHHLIEADHWLIEKLSNPSFPSFKGSKGKIHISRREEYHDLLSELEKSLISKTVVLGEMTSDQWSEEITDDRFGGMVTKWWVIFRGNLDHEIHHRGQLSSYLRVLQDQGVELHD